MRRRLALVLLSILCTVGCDRATKEWAYRHLRTAPPRSYLSGTVRVVYTENTGAFLGLGGGLPPGVRFLLFTVASGAFLLGLMAWTLKREATAMGTIAPALVVGGGLGNIVDRAAGGGVIDFLNLGIGSLRTGIFNVADMAITLGVVLLLTVRHSPRPPKGGEG
jgi:signal peptidase II